MIRTGLRRLLAMFQRRRLDAEMDRDIGLHLEMAEEENLRRGMSPEAARREARRSFGGVQQVREELRQGLALAWLDGLCRDSKHALRSLARSPGFTAVAVITLALGIGGTAAVFSVVDPLLVRQLPVERPEELVLVRVVNPVGGPRETTDILGYTFVEELEADETSFAGLFVSDPPSAGELLYEDGSRDSEPVWIEPVSGGYFSILGVDAMFGRVFGHDDDSDSVPLVAVVSHSFWKNRLGGVSNVIGAALAIDFEGERAATIVGVAPPAFRGTDIDRPPDVWLPYHAIREPVRELSRLFSGLAIRGVRIMGRLGSEAGVSAAQVGIDLRASQSDDPLVSRYRTEGRRVVLEPGARGYSELRFEFAEPLWILLAASALVLLIICANLAALVLARGAARGPETTVRLALGSSRPALLRHLIAEGLLLAAIGIPASVAIAYWGSRALRSYLPRDSTFFGMAGVDLRLLVFMVSISVAAVLLFGLLPALRLTRPDRVPLLKRVSADSGGEARVHKGIVMVQVAFSLLLLVLLGLSVRTLGSLRDLETGYDRENVVQFSVEAPIVSLRDVADALTARLEALPGVEAVARYSPGPLLAGTGSSVTLVDGPEKAGGETFAAALFSAGPRMFETLGVEVVAGSVSDTGEFDTPVVVTRSLARRLFGDQDAVGRSLAGLDGIRDGQILGVVEDVRVTSLRANESYVVFLAERAISAVAARFLVRTTGAAAGIIPALEPAIREIDPEFRIGEVETLEQAVDRALAREHTVVQLLGAFALFALLLTSMGVYGVLSYAVTRRRGEIGIRMALGARSGQVLRMVLRETATIIVAGLVLGLAAALTTTRWIESFLFGVAPTDPASIVVGVLLLALAGGLAGYLPARRASRIDPLSALRHE